ncbi:MAG: LysR family transcriptional regulator, partial [Candidatus Omnitrophota bacterium]|nr:LysR family transcriptional regulator [Candidatus Omnitrophota bacterium]
MIPFNYHHLYYFFTIAKTGSVSKACEQLRLAQSTVSAQLKQFEAYLGRLLFERRNQRLYLTEDGRAVLDYAESIFALGRELQDTLRDRPPGGRRLLQVGMLNGTPEVFTHALICAVLEQEPSAQLSVQEGPLEWLLTELEHHRLDLLLTDVPVQQRTHGASTNQLVGKISVVFVAAPALAKKYRHFPRDLESAPLILPMVPSQVYLQVQTFFAERKISPRIVAEVQDVEVARRLALSGHGVTPLNVHTLSVSLPAGGLVALGK